MAIYPNPAHTQIFFSGISPSTVEQLQIMASDGRILISISRPQNNCIRVDDCPCGLYLLRVVQKTGNTSYQKFNITQ